MKNHRDRELLPQSSVVAQLLAARAVQNRHDITRWIEASRSPCELPSIVDIAKRDGLLSDLTRRLGG